MGGALGRPDVAALSRLCPRPAQQRADCAVSALSSKFEYFRIRVSIGGRESGRRHRRDPRRRERRRRSVRAGASIDGAAQGFVLTPSTFKVQDSITTPHYSCSEEKLRQSIDRGT